jgi:hypothetical protein
MVGKSHGREIVFGVRLKEGQGDICGTCLREALGDCVYRDDVAESTPEGA